MKKESKVLFLLAIKDNNLSAYTIKNLSADTINNLSADTINNLSADTIKNLSADTIKNLSADTINNLSAYTINNLSAYTINNLSAYTIKNLSADTINNLSAYTINNLSAYTINNLSAYTINNLSAYTIKNLSADTIKNLSAYTIKKIRPELLEGYYKFWESVPKLEKPYTQLLTDIKEKKRTHNQSTFGTVEDFDPALNVCGTPMCTAGHLVNMAGKVGYELKKKYGWEAAATFIHRKSLPDFPVQNFGSIPQSWAMSYIEAAAEFEKTGEMPQL
jgi:hypothetical protein